jgi:prephenate dehydrogenase
MRELLFNNVTIIGVGLLGASCALALKGRGLCGTVCGYGRKEANLRQAKDRGIIDEYSLEIRKACEHADLVILSTPVGSFKKIVREIRDVLKKNTLITDVGSVKGHLVKELEELMPEGVRYVGSHPIAGSDRSGIGNARADLFDGVSCIVTPSACSEKNAVQQITTLWESCGANVEIMDPMRHDEIYAAVSHLPHLIAYALVNTVDDSNAEYLKYAGPGFKDTTRIALSSPEMWRDISLLNRNNLIALIERFGNNLDIIASMIRNADAEGLEHEFSKARTLREKC